MAEANVFDPDARLELVEGEILEMSPVRPPHAFTASELERLLAAGLRDRAVLRGQYPIVCGEISQPQPDLALAVWPPDRYSRGTLQRRLCRANDTCRASSVTWIRMIRSISGCGCPWRSVWRCT